MKRYLPFVLAYLLFLGIGTALSASTSLCFAPATAPVSVDSLPMGRHQVSSYRNGASTEFTVENGEIQSLKIDGKTIPPSEYAQYESQVEEMLGGKSAYPSDNYQGHGILNDLHGLDGDADRLEEYFERHGEKWERIGEEMAERIEEMFDFDREGSSFRFYFDGEDGSTFDFDIDSIRQRRDVDILEFDLDDLVEEKERGGQSPQQEIEELETMIERMERRKADAEERVRRLEERGNDDDTFTLNGFSMERSLQSMRDDGLIEPGVIRSFAFSAKELRINGKKADSAAHKHLLKEASKAFGGKVMTLELDGLNW